jgi:YVTN family beta-propeller protein
VPVGTGPHLHLGYLRETGRVWVSNTGGDDITLLDEASGEVTGRIACGAGPAHFVFDAACEVGCVALTRDDAVAVVDPRRETVTGRVELPAGSHPTAIMPAFERSRVYSLNPGLQSVSALDPGARRVAATIPVGPEPMWGQPWGSSYKPITRPVGRSHFVSAGSNAVTVVDDATDTVLCTVPVGRRPVRNAIFRERGLIYVANEADGTVGAIRIEDDRPSAAVPVGIRPFRMLPVQAICGRDELWVLNAGSPERPAGLISIVGAEPAEVVGALPVPERPANWVVNPAGLLFVVAGSRRELAVLDIRTGAQVGEGRLSRDPQPGAISGLVYTRSEKLFILNSDATVSVFRAS